MQYRLAWYLNITLIELTANAMGNMIIFPTEMASTYMGRRKYKSIPKKHKDHETYYAKEYCILSSRWQEKPIVQH
jgi:hypothetical protein